MGKENKEESPHRTLAFLIGRFLVLYGVFLAFIFATIWAIIGLYFTLHWFFSKQIHLTPILFSIGLVSSLMMLAIYQAIKTRK